MQVYRRLRRLPWEFDDDGDGDGDVDVDVTLGVVTTVSIAVAVAVAVAVAIAMSILRGNERGRRVEQNRIKNAISCFRHHATLQVLSQQRSLKQMFLIRQYLYSYFQC